MANTFYTQKSSMEPLELNAPASTTEDIGSFMYWDGTSLLKAITAQTTQASEALDQQLFASNFAGVARSARLSTDTAAGPIRIDVDLVAQVPVVSNTFKPGDFLGPTWDGGSALVDKKLAKVTNRCNAIAVCMELQASAVTSLWVRFISSKFSTFGDMLNPAQIHVIGGSTAAAGSSTSDAGALPAGTADVYPTTGADDTKGVKINAADQVTGKMLFIGNGVSNKILKVYGPSGATINGAGADAAFSSASGKGVIALCLSGSGNTWFMW